MIAPQPIDIVYDDQCPVCRTYCTRLKSKEGDELRLVDARKPSALMDEITKRGLDIDQGMVVKIGDNLYYGSDAIAILSQHTKRSNFVGHLNFYIFRSRFLAGIVYPLCKEARNLLLRVLRISKIDNLNNKGLTNGACQKE